ncbi:hydrogenase maturation nickel metallochaperone HypA [Verrucomicrobiota bacterium]
MHELSICQSLVDSIIAELDKIEPRPKSLVKARMIVGELRQIVPEYMHEAYSAISKGTIIEGSELEIKTVAISGKCKACGWKGDLQRALFRCKECESGDLDLSGGMELYLDNLEVEKEEKS